MPRGRLVDGDGVTHEFHSQLLPRYARRTREIDEAILGCYLGGVNSRRIHTALKPLLGERHLSESAVSRIIAKAEGVVYEVASARPLYGALSDRPLGRLPSEDPRGPSCGTRTLLVTLRRCVRRLHGSRANAGPHFDAEGEKYGGLENHCTLGTLGMSRIGARASPTHDAAWTARRPSRQRRHLPSSARRVMVTDRGLRTTWMGIPHSTSR